MQSEHRTFLTAGGPLRSPLSADASTHLQETVISTLVAGMLPVIGSKSYTDDVSSSLSITSPSIMSIARARGGSGVIREAHSLAPAVRSESPVTPDNRSETRRPPVRPGEAATSQMLKLKRMERRVPSEGTPRGGEGKGKGRTWLTLRSVNTFFFFLISEITVALSPTCWTSHGEVDRALLLSSPCAHSGACEEEWLHTLKPTHPPPTRNYNQVLATLYTGAAVVTLQHPV